MNQKPGYQACIELIKVLCLVCSPEKMEKIYLKHIKTLIEEFVNEKHKAAGHALTNNRKCDLITAMAYSIDMSTNYEITKKFIKSFLPEKFGY